MVFHWHHLVPKHAGGDDSPRNRVRVNVAMHAFMHKLRYSEKGDEYDLIAYRALMGQIGSAEAAHEARKAFAAQNPDHHREAGRKGGKAPPSEKTREAARENMRKLNLRPHVLKECPHCGWKMRANLLSRHIRSKHH